MRGWFLIDIFTVFPYEVIKYVLISLLILIFVFYAAPCAP